MEFAEPSAKLIITRENDTGIQVYAVNGTVSGCENGQQEVIYEPGSAKTIVNINSGQTILPVHGHYHTLTLKIDTTGESSWSNTSTDSACWDSYEDPDDVLPYACKEFFEKRRESLDSWTSTRQSDSLYHLNDKESEFNRKLGLLRQEIASLVQQDDALFRQLLSLHASITALREATDDEDSASTSPWLSPTPSVSSLSLDDDERLQVVPVRPARRKQLLQNAQRLQDEESSRLTRQKISYPPKSRNRVLRHPSAYARDNSPTQTPSSPTWSTASPTSSEDETNKIMVGCITVIHRRQSSYDSGIQGSEPSDGEVFV